MGNPYADEFLTCVLDRPRTDVTIRLSMLITVMGMLPLIFFGITMLIYFMTEEILVEPSLGLMLYVFLMSTYVLYVITQTAYDHHERDIRWANVLTNYAGSKGKDTTELSAIASELTSDRSDILRKILMVYVGFQGLVSLAVCAYVCVNDFSADILRGSINLFSTVFLIQIGIISCFQFVYTRKYDDVQQRFTVALSDAFGGELKTPAMNTGIKLRKLWPHIAVMVCTFGIYVLLFGLLTVHTMNMHMARQWTYEESLLREIAEMEGANGIEIIPMDYGTGIKALIRKIF